MTSIALPTLLPPILGGLTICAAINLDLKLEKRIPSPSNTLSSLISLDSHTKWRSSFIAGFMFASALAWLLFGDKPIPGLHMRIFENSSEFLSGISSIGFMISGFLVGAGSKLADGGLTKFGFYGVPRLSKRAFTATSIILGFGGLIATYRNHHMFFGENDFKDFSGTLDSRVSLIIPLIILAFSVYKTEGRVQEVLTSFFMGSLLSVGTMLSGLAQRHKVLNFLTVNSSWDPFLLFVLAASFLTNLVLFRVILGRFESVKPAVLTTKTDSRLILGCCFLGAGLGICGLTPGSALLVTPLYLPQLALLFMPLVAFGQYCAEPMGNWLLDELKVQDAVSAGGSHQKMD